MIVFLSHTYCCCYKSRDLGQSCQVNAATAASSSLIGSLWPEIQFDGELYMQNHWIINQFNDHMADSTRFCQTCSQIPWSRFLHNDTIFANCFERTALVPGRNTVDKKMWYYLIFAGKNDWITHWVTDTDIGKKKIMI